MHREKEERNRVLIMPLMYNLALNWIVLESRRSWKSMDQAAWVAVKGLVKHST